MKKTLDKVIELYDNESSAEEAEIILTSLLASLKSRNLLTGKDNDSEDRNACHGECRQ